MDENRVNHRENNNRRDGITPERSRPDQRNARCRHVLTAAAAVALLGIAAGTGGKLQAADTGSIGIQIPVEDAQNRMVDADGNVTWYFNESPTLLIDISEANLNLRETKVTWIETRDGISTPVESDLSGLRCIGYKTTGTVDLPEGAAVSDIRVIAVDYAGNTTEEELADTYVTDTEGPEVTVELGGDVKSAVVISGASDGQGGEQNLALCVWKDPAMVKCGVSSHSTAEVEVTVTVKDSNLQLADDAEHTYDSDYALMDLSEAGFTREISEGAVVYRLQTEVADGTSLEIPWAFSVADAAGNLPSGVGTKVEDGETFAEAVGTAETEDGKLSVSGCILAERICPTGADGGEFTAVPVTAAAGTVGDGTELYSTGIQMQVAAVDPADVDGYCGGLDSVTWQIGDTAGIIGTDGNGVACGGQRTAEAIANLMQKLAGENDTVVFTVTAADLAGNSTVYSKTLAFDFAAPRVQVVYDNNDVRNEKYFPAARRARIYVDDLNVSQSDLEIFTGGTQGLWTRTETGWCNTVDFSEDGSYTLQLSIHDKAGNYAQIDYSNGGANASPQEFIVDQTAPVIMIRFDKQEATNSLFFNTARTATLQIAEANFNGSLVTTQVSARRDGQELTAPSHTEWTGSGLVSSTITFTEDGDYTLCLQAEDPAGNVSDIYEVPMFTIDRTEPTLTVTGVEDRSACGGAVEPRLFWSDRNLIADNCTAELVQIRKLTERTAVDFTAAKTGSARTASLRMEDLPHTEENDGIYILTVTGEDLAGNQVEREILYSLNRFGSTYYTADAATGKLLESGYSSEAPSIEVVEINPDTLTSHTVMHSVGSASKNLTEGVDYTVTAVEDLYSWKEYHYRVLPQSYYNANGLTEGNYITTFMSVDRAGNYNTNRTVTNSLPVTYTVDATAPVIYLTGLQDGDVIEGDEVNAAVYYEDNTALESVTVYRGDEVIAELSGTTLAEHPGVYEVKLTREQGDGELHACARDRAGNVARTAGTAYTFYKEEVEETIESQENVAAPAETIAESEQPEIAETVASEPEQSGIPVILWWVIGGGILLIAGLLLWFFLLVKGKDREEKKES